MRWMKFANFAAQNLGLSTCLQEHIGPPALRHIGHNPEFRIWVEHQVDYVAVRPFELLDLAATDAYSTGRDNSSIGVQYVVWFHIDGEERPCSRLSSLASKGPGFTLQQLIDGLVEWHPEYWALQPGQPPLVIDAIVRHTRRLHPSMEHYRESVEFFIVPENARPQK